MKLWNPGAQCEDCALSTRGPCETEFLGTVWRLTVIGLCSQAFWPCLLQGWMFCFQTMFSFLGETSENMCPTWISCSGALYVLENKHGIWLTLSGPLRYIHKEYKSFVTVVLPTFPNLIYKMRTFFVVTTWPKLGDPYSNRMNCAIAPSFQHFLAILQVARLLWACFSVAVIKHGDQRHLKTWQQEQI